MHGFARNTVEPQQLALFAAAVATQTERKWLLVDHGIVDSAKSTRISAVLGWKAWPAYEGSALGSFGMSSPHIHEVPELPPQALSEAVARWLSVEPTAAGLSIVCSNAGPTQLQQTLTYLAMNTVDGDLRLHCRCADVRVLTNLLPVLTAPQRQRVAMGAQSWWWIGTTGSVEKWLGPPTAGASHALADQREHLHLDAAQFRQMMDESEPDIMFAMLLDKTSELVPATDRGAFRGRLQRILATASHYSVKQPPDRLQFLVLSLATGENFHAHPGLGPTWRNIRERGASLKQEMSTWSDDLWAEIDNGRRPAQ